LKEAMKDGDGKGSSLARAGLGQPNDVPPFKPVWDCFCLDLRWFLPFELLARYHFFFFGVRLKGGLRGKEERMRKGGGKEEERRRN